MWKRRFIQGTFSGETDAHNKKSLVDLDRERMAE